MRSRHRPNVLAWVVLAALFVHPHASSANKPSPNPATFTGPFTVTVRGFWSGQGQAIVTKNSVVIQATVTDDNGNVGTLVVSNLPIVGNHFVGTGNVLGLDLRIEGRVESKDLPAGGTGKGKAKGKGKGISDEQVLTDARIGATFTAGAHAGRIAGSRDR